MPAHTDSLIRRQHAALGDMLDADMRSHDQRKTLLLTLGDLPDDIDDREAAAIVIAATGGSRAEIQTLLGYDNPQSASNWKVKRNTLIQQARDNIHTLISGMSRLAMAELVVASLDAARVVVRSIPDAKDAEKRLATLARAGRDLASVCMYLDTHAATERERTSRIGVAPYHDAPAALVRDCQQSTAQLTELVSPDT